MTKSEFENPRSVRDSDLPLHESMHRHKRRDKERSQGRENHRKRKASRSLRLARRHKQQEIS